MWSREIERALPFSDLSNMIWLKPNKMYFCHSVVYGENAFKIQTDGVSDNNEYNYLSSSFRIRTIAIELMQYTEFQTSIPASNHQTKWKWNFPKLTKYSCGCQKFR